MSTPASSPTATADIVRACFTAYERKDRRLIESLLADEFTFTSPLDDCISRERYFERCWPNSEHIDAVRIEHLFVQGDQAFVQYQIQTTGKPPFRNTEFFTLRDGQVTHVDVYFGAETGEAAAQEGDPHRRGSLGRVDSPKGHCGCARPLRRRLRPFLSRSAAAS